jgi:hypothetical protein
MERPPLEQILEFAGDRAAGCASSDSHHHRIYAPGSAHGVTCGLILDVGFIMLLCMGHQSHNFSWQWKLFWMGSDSVLEIC